MVIVRPATEADQQRVVEIVRAARINPMDLKWPNFVVAVDEATGAIVGTGQVKQHRDGSYELASLATIPEHQRRGIAHQVVAALLDGHPGKLYLTCLDTLGSFYEQFGFRRVSEADLTPYFRRLRRVAAAFHFLTSQDRELLVMVRDEAGDDRPQGSEGPRGLGN